MKFLSVLLLASIAFSAQSQVFYEQSFESEIGWTLSHTFDDGNDIYSKRDNVSALDELGYILTGADETFALAFEDTDELIGEAPEDGIITLTLEAVNISGLTDLEAVVKLSCNVADMAYDSRDLTNGDYCDIQVRIDGGAWVTIGQFNSRSGGSNISQLYHDVDMDGNGGELGELPVNNAMSDFVIPISSSGNTAELRARIRMNGTDEVLVLDDIRLRESQGDDTPPSVFSASLVDQNTLQIVFQEPMSSAANQLFYYAGVSGLSSATLQPDQQTVILDYASNFIIGQAYQLIVFSVPDLAGNPMASAFNFPFHYNPTTPDLVITEVMYNDPSVEDTLEFIEVYNNGITAAIVGGFRLDNAVNHIFASVTIPPGGFYLVARDAISAENFYGIPFNDYSGQLSDNNETILLVNAEGVLLDEVNYNDNVPWPSAADGFGPSMELASADLDNDIGSNWVASTNGLGFINGFPLSATPGELAGVVLPVVQFDNGTLTVNEPDGVFELDIYISASNVNTSTISLEVIPGTADSPADHGVLNGTTLVLPANSGGIEQFAFPLVNDALTEGAEFFTVRMTAVENCVIGLNQEFTIFILDDEFTEPQVFINEIQSDNSTTIQDSFGDYDDWFELYNPNGFAVDLTGYYLSDDPSDLTKDRIIDPAALIIPAEGHLLFWADEQGEQGSTHMNFRLSANGESLILTAPDGTTVIDQRTFGEISQDWSDGRFCDGEPVFTFYQSPTPGAPNCALSLNEWREGSLNIYPNPVSEILFLPSQLVYELLDMTGRMVKRGQADQVDVSDLDSGTYILRVMDGHRVIVVE